MLRLPNTPSTAQSHEQMLDMFGCLHAFSTIRRISATDNSGDLLYLMTLRSAVRASDCLAARLNVLIVTAAGLMLSADVKAPVHQACLPFK